MKISVPLGVCFFRNHLRVYSVDLHIDRPSRWEICRHRRKYLKAVHAQLGYICLTLRIRLLGDKNVQMTTKVKPSSDNLYVLTWASSTVFVAWKVSLRPWESVCMCSSASMHIVNLSVQHMLIIINILVLFVRQCWFRELLVQARRLKCISR